MQRNAAETQRDTGVKTQMKLWKGYLPTWDKEKFLLIAADRGYLSERSAVYAVSVAIDVTYSQARTLLRRGRFKWEQILVIGAKFEMTPKEFCDCFLSGYFSENASGHFRAHLTDSEQKAVIHPMPNTVHSRKEWDSFFKE